jgi:FixJ family two-component response regulator
MQMLFEKEQMDAKKNTSEASVLRSSTAEGGPLVAIVDDDASVRVSTLRLLRWSGLRAEAFSCAEEFLRSEFLFQAACVLVDVRMPGMGGLELQRRLVETGRPIPIVFFSARASEEEEKRAVQAGAVEFLRKPVRKETLLHAIRSVFESQANNQSNEL